MDTRGVAVIELNPGFSRGAVILLNRGQSDADINVNWDEIGYPNHISAKVRDLWEHKDLGSFTGTFKAKVLPHIVVMVKVLP